MEMSGHSVTLSPKFGDQCAAVTVAAKCGILVVPMEIHYRNIPCRQMTEQDILGCSNVFSENYGEWSDAAPSARIGRAIRISPARIRSMFVEKPDRYVALMYDGDRLIGQAFYLRRPCPWQASKMMTFILQLVLEKGYRGHRLGLKLLQSVFGLSDNAAWGLFTSNPLTVRALEDATFRHVSVSAVKRHVQDLKQVLDDVFDGVSWLDSFHDGCVDTQFPVNHGANDAKIRKAYPDGGFPFTSPLGKTEEWLAVVFHSQNIDFNAAALRLFTTTSWEVLRDAYSRMDVTRQGWTRYAQEEIATLFDRGWVKQGASVLDLGCGIGRHVLELARRDCVAHGVDFFSRLIRIAREGADGCQNATFEQADILSYEPRQQYDLVLCVYDVIGSSTEETENQQIVDKIWRALKPNGVAVVSVMNRELVQHLCRSADNRVEHIEDAESFQKLVKLPPSTTMQDSGEIFKSQLMILETSTGTVYRKEQFTQNDLMPVEYVISDKRYSRDELQHLFGRFETLQISYVRAGRWGESLMPTERHAKEVLGVFRKRQGALSSLFSLS